MDYQPQQLVRLVAFYKERLFGMQLQLQLGNLLLKGLENGLAFLAAGNHHGDVIVEAGVVDAALAHQAVSMIKHAVHGIAVQWRAHEDVALGGKGFTVSRVLTMGEEIL